MYNTEPKRRSCTLLCIILPGVKLSLEYICRSYTYIFIKWRIKTWPLFHIASTDFQILICLSRCAHSKIWKLLFSANFQYGLKADFPQRSFLFNSWRPHEHKVSLSAPWIMKQCKSPSLSPQKPVMADSSVDSTSPRRSTMLTVPGFIVLVWTVELLLEIASQVRFRLHFSSFYAHISIQLYISFMIRWTRNMLLQTIL